VGDVAEKQREFFHDLLTPKWREKWDRAVRTQYAVPRGARCGCLPRLGSPNSGSNRQSCWPTLISQTDITPLYGGVNRGRKVLLPETTDTSWATKKSWRPVLIRMKLRGRDCCHRAEETQSLCMTSSPQDETCAAPLALLHCDHMAIGVGLGCARQRDKHHGLSMLPVIRALLVRSGQADDPFLGTGATSFKPRPGARDAFDLGLTSCCQRTGSRIAAVLAHGPTT